MIMACINALAFCVAHRDFSDEKVLVQELSKVKEQLSQGLQYFTSKPSTTSKPLTLKDQVQRFLGKLSMFLDLSEDRCLDLLLHYLASRNTDNVCDEDQVQNFIADGYISDLLNRIRVFYWQERLSLLGLFRVIVCDWHGSWTTLADVLFAMTPYASRTELLHSMLKEYTKAASTTESLLVDGHYGSMRLAQPANLTDLESQDEFDLTVAQHLKEQLEMLNVIFTGVHAISDADSPSSSCFFAKLLEAFWSKSFGLQPCHIQSLTKHRSLVDRICFTQTLILIRAANLDCLVLFNPVSENSTTNSTGGSHVKRITKRSSSGQQTEPRTMSTGRRHFLYDAHLLNRLLASLSGLGDSPVHGPLLLFGAICATAFTPSLESNYPHRLEAGDTLSGDWGPADDRKLLTGGNPGREGCAEGSETAHLVASQYAQIAIETLGVFRFLNDQLTDFEKPISCRLVVESDSTLQEETRVQPGIDLNMVDFCAHVAVFDLLCLLAQHVVLWTLDGLTVHASNSTRPTQSNRAAYISLFSHTLGVVAHWSELTTRTHLSSTGSEVSGLGKRISGLIESLAEAFPCDLSLLHLCTALIVPASNRGSQADIGLGDGNTLVQLVSDLVTALPYLTEPITPELQRLVVHQSSVSLYPQFSRGDQVVANQEVALNQMRTVFDVDWRQRTGSAVNRQRYATPSALYAGVRLPSGTRGKMEPDFGWIVWKHEYPVWNVVSYEVEKALKLLDRIQSYLGAHPSAQLQFTPPRSKAGKITRETAPYAHESHQVVYTTLFDQLVRVQQLVRFLTACVEAQIHVSTCLYLMEDVWLLLQRVLNISGELTELVQSPAHSPPPNSIPDLLFNQMIPSVLRLLASAFSGMSATGTVQLLTDHAALWNYVLLSEVSRFFPRMTVARPGKTSQSLFSLGASHLTGALSACANDSPTISLTPGGAPTAAETPIRHALLSSYLEFLFGLLTGIKWMCTLTRSGLTDLAIESIEAWINQAVEVLQGGLLVTVNCVVIVGANALKSDRWLLTTSPPLRTDRDRWLLVLAERSFVLLTDLLTTHSSAPEIKEACSILNTSLSNRPVVALSDLRPTANAPHVIAALQAVTLRLLLDNPCALQGLLAFSSIPLHSLLVQFKALDQGLTVGISSTDHGLGSLPPANQARSIATVVWFGLTLVHHVLGLEQAMLESREPSSSNTPSTSLLSNLTAYVDPATREHYVAVLFTYLRYPYNVGLSRSAVTLLKWLTQHTSVNIMDYLSPDSSTAVRDCVLTRLSSSCTSGRTNDPLTRVALFDLVAETVLTSPADRTGKRSAQFLRFLTPSPNPSIGSKGSGAAKPTCLDCCITVLNEIQVAHKSTIPDQLSLLLLNSVTKLIAALYLQEANAYINVLKSKPNFWQLLTAPVFQLLQVDENVCNEFSQVEHEYCGHVASILGLELFCSQSSSGSTKPSDAVQLILNRMAKDNVYFSWFQLVANTLHHLQSISEVDSETSTMDCIGPVLSSLYEATCRWKCLLMVHLDWLRQTEVPSEDEPAQDNKVIALKTTDTIDQLIRSLHHMKPFFELSAASDLANQLAVCLSITVNQNRSSTLAESNEDSCESQLAQLIDFLMTVRPGLDEQAKHLHADLLACANTLWHKLYSSRKCTDSDAKSGRLPDTIVQLQVDVTDCAFGYVAQLATYPTLSVADEATLRQAISLLVRLWDTNELSPFLHERLIQSGVLNNLLVTLEQHCQSKTGAALCHDILILVMRILLTNDYCSFSKDRPLRSADLEMEQSDEPDRLSDFQLTFSSAQVIGSYGDSLIRAFSWPPTDTLLQWVHEDEVLAQQNMVSHSYFSAMGNWTQLILVQLRFLCLLHDRLGGLQQPFVARLIDQCCTQNGSQMQALFRSWCSPLYDRDRVQRQLTPLPQTACLMHDGSLPPSRLELACAVGAVYWRLLVSGQSLNASPLVSGSGIPAIGSNVLYGNNASHNGEKPAYSPIYGPNPTAQFITSVWDLTTWQLHCCSVLLQRFGLRLGFKVGVGTSASGNSSSGTPLNTTGSGSSGTPNKALTVHARGAAASPRRSQTPSNAGRTDVSSQQQLSATQFAPEPELGDTCSGETELTCLVRQLVMCLSILNTQLPLLGRMTLFTTEELQELRPSVQLVFSTPSLEDNSPQLTFGVLITLAHSLSYLFLKVSRHIRSNSPATKSACELSASLAQAHEMTVSVMLSQATLILLHEHTSPAEKQLLVRELTSELKSCNLFGHTSRRRHSFGHRSSHSPSSRSSSTARALLRNTSPHTTTVHSTSVAAAAAADLHSIGTKLNGPDLNSFGFEQAIDRFAELLRLSM